MLKMLNFKKLEKITVFPVNEMFNRPEETFRIDLESTPNST